MQGTVDALCAGAHGSIHQKAFEQGASGVYLLVAAAFADGCSCVLWPWLFQLLALEVLCAGTAALHGMNCPCPGEGAVAALLGATAA